MVIVFIYFSELSGFYNNSNYHIDQKKGINRMMIHSHRCTYILLLFIFCSLINISDGTGMMFKLTSHSATTFQSQDRFELLKKHHFDIKNNNSKKNSDDIDLPGLDNFGTKERKKSKNIVANAKLLYSNLVSLDIGIGTSQDNNLQVLKVVLDTGSANLFVTGSKCNSDVCNSHIKFNPELSKTNQRLNEGKEYSITFGSGSYRGELYSDEMLIGGNKTGAINLSNQTFLVADSLSGDTFSTKDFSGVLGLAFRDMAVEKHLTVFDHIVQDHLVEDNQFYFYMPLEMSKNDKGEDKDLENYEMYFVMGKPDHFDSHYEGEFKTHQVIQKHYWTVQLDDLLYGNTSLLSPKLRKKVCDKSGICKIAFDSGCSASTMPKEVLKTFLDKLSCAHKTKSQPLTYVINGEKYTLDPEDYLVDFDPSSKCHVATVLQELNLHSKFGPLFILGHYFHRKYLVIYQKLENGNGQVKIAKATKKKYKKDIKYPLRNVILEKLSIQV